MKIESSHNGDLWHHANLEAAEQKYPLIDFESYTVFYSVRHPMDWLVSRWLANNRKREGFSKWIRHWGPHIFDMFQGDTTKFIQYESLEDDILSQIGFKVSLELNPDHRTAEKNPWPTYWIIDDVYWARKHFTDFQRYNYAVGD